MSENHITASPAPGKNFLPAVAGGRTMLVDGRLLAAAKEDWSSEAGF
jgi:hypothetical protein